MPLLRMPGGTVLLALVSMVFSGTGYSTDQELLPGGRQSIVLREGERNPFGQAPVALVQEIEEKQVTETEEIRLRKILGSIKVGGRSSHGKSTSLLLGSLILKEGDQLPPLVENQTEILKISTISDKEAVLSFYERDRTAEPRHIIIPLSMKPKVSSLLYGAVVKSLVPTGKDGRPSLEKLKMDNVDVFLKGTRASDLQSLAERQFEMMGEQNVSGKKPDSQ